ncbi:hypothetical protein [Blastococcus tunisiensis]|uniref:DUF4878 domain-containing protein n=1 Tax=Blastococcus tunisiensis TaxID=1798228 RepID=A0A1I2ACG4_9ACTN|nr:hypothetical protein [Blastococcus sp. DSM 46838]SFE41499.1 hypothetical protein SAMN05216574_103280 [Blastococcus sp. DSM 46838]
MTTGPFLYDDGPEPLHTGAPQRSGKWLVLIFGGTVLFAVLMVAMTLLLRGSGADQAREVAGVFVEALSQDDLEVAYELLCVEEQARLAPEDVAATYLGEGTARIGTPVEDGDARLVPVEWSDGATVELTVVGQDGLRVCGIAAGG